MSLGAHNEERRREMELRLAVLATMPLPERPLTQAELGELCGCSGSNIALIEQTALKKLRRMLKKSGFRE